MHPDLLSRICKLVYRKKFGLICFPLLIYCDQEPQLLLNLTVHLFGCTYKAISTRYKICFTPKSLNFSMGASLLAVAKSIYIIIFPYVVYFNIRFEEKLPDLSHDIENCFTRLLTFNQIQDLKNARKKAIEMNFTHNSGGRTGFETSHRQFRRLDFFARVCTE